MPITFTPKFITPDDYNNYWGHDLKAEARESDNPSNFANLFLLHVEDEVKDWVDANTARNYQWDEIKTLYGEDVFEQFQKALLYQAHYIYYNSDLFLDSGIEPGKGVITKLEDINKAAVCQETINALKSAGLLNHVLGNSLRYTSFI
jgi:hypothetical protein